MSDDMMKALLQEELGKTGDAEGQCPSCGVFRSDGQPPILHRAACEAPGLIQSSTFAWRPPS